MDEIINYSINEISERLSVSNRSLHYWEEKLSLKINRDNQGCRIYSESDVYILEEIKLLKSKGMNLEGIKKFLEEKGMLKESSSNSITVVKDNSLELKEIKDFLMGELKEVFSKEMSVTNEKLDKVLKENIELKGELHKMQNQTAEHFSKVDVRLTEWKNGKPWYKKLFKN